MSRMKRIAFDGVPGRVLAKHLRMNGIKSTADTQLYDVLNVRSDKTAEQLAQLAHQLPGCKVVVRDVNRV